MTQQSKIRLLIADDHDVVRSGLKSMLEGTEIKVVGEVATGQAAVNYVLKNEVDVVLLDVRMPDGDGLNTLGRIKLDKPHQPILMLSYVDNPAYLARAVALGANGYLLKDCTRDELVGAIKIAAAGENTWTRERLRRITGGFGDAKAPGRRRSPFDRTGGPGAAAHGRGPDKQADCRRAGSQLRNRQGARPARTPQDWRLRPDTGSGMGRAQGTGLNRTTNCQEGFGSSAVLPAAARPHQLKGVAHGAPNRSHLYLFARRRGRGTPENPADHRRPG